jgi:hypothetical protein
MFISRGSQTFKSWGHIHLSYRLAVHKVTDWEQFIGTLWQWSILLFSWTSSVVQCSEMNTVCYVQGDGSAAVSALGLFIALMMEAVCTPETSVYIMETTRRYIPQTCHVQGNMHTHIHCNYRFT